MFHLIYENNLGVFHIFPMVCHGSKFRKLSTSIHTTYMCLEGAENHITGQVNINPFAFVLKFPGKALKK